LLRWFLWFNYGIGGSSMTDKVDSAIYIYDVEFNKIKTIKLKTFLKRVNHTLRNKNQIYFALKNDAIKSREEDNA
jgi:hypothetical protein